MSAGPGLQATRTVGGLIPPGLFARIRSGEVGDAEGLSTRSYHLAGRETVRDAANRAWSYLRGRWTDWRRAAEGRPGDRAGTGLARSEWLTKLFEQLGYGQLQPTRGGLRVEDTEFPISHVWQHVPIHLLGPGVDLDHRNPGVAGASRAPQAMLQELLNRTDEHLWAFLSNGLRLRVLRDSTSLAGSAYIEFDLEEIFDGLLFDEFLLLWQLCHVSRVEKRGRGSEGADTPASDCWLESWREDVRASGTRALKELRVGVEQALVALGTGFLRHPDNGELRAALYANRFTREDFHRALLRLVYRLLFLSVAEDRGLLHPGGTPAQVKQRYADYFSVGRLRRLARIRSGGPHRDLWESLRVVLGALGGDGLPRLGLPVLAGLFDPADTALDGSGGRTDVLADAALANQDLLTAMRSLGWIRFRGQRIQPVDYRNLDAEELGSIYESLLELVPRVDLVAREFTMESISGNDRKTTGSYYTPASLVDALLDSALDPLLTDARKNAADAAEWERNLLALTVCDPACGSGHFLVAAARRIARELAQARSGEDEPAPADVHHALRDVIGHCVYGVDVNPMAAELAKVSLWLEALEPGKPLGFLDSRIRVGNSLLGTTPALLADGLPDEAFKVLPGDDPKVANEVKKRNRAERVGQDSLFDGDPDSNAELARHRNPLLTLENYPAGVRAQARQWEQYEAHDPELHALRTQADTWCAAFVWKLAKGSPEAPTTALVSAVPNHRDQVPDAVVAEVQRLAQQYGFLHWHLEFPEIFRVPAGENGTGPDGWTGGFSCLLGNPPWEHTELKEQEFFAVRDSEIAAAAGATRKSMIKALHETDPPLWRAFEEAKRLADGTSKVVRASGRYPLTARGRINTYAIFAETFRTLTDPHGRSGVIVPTGIATDATTQYFFKDLVEAGSLATLYDFENAAPVFDGVHRNFKFSLLTMAGRNVWSPAADFAFFLHDAADIEACSFAITPEEILLLNPNTGTAPVFRSRRDAEITLGIYRRVPALIKENDPDGNSWAISFMQGLFNMTSDSHLFHTREQLEADGWTLIGNTFTCGGDRLLPLYEAKMLHHYDHRWATYDGTDVRGVTLEEKQDPGIVAIPRYWVDRSNVVATQPGTLRGRGYILAFRDITNGTNERTNIASLVPNVAIGNNLPIIVTNSDNDSLLLEACLSSFVHDYAARIKIPWTHMNFFVLKQLPVMQRQEFHHAAHWDSQCNVGSWVAARVIELSNTCFDISGLGPPFQWAPERRVLLRAELDAAFFHLYGVNRDDADYILDTFPIVKRKDEAAYGEYRTKRLILEVYDKMAEAIRTGEPYQTILDPPPGQGPRHPARSSDDPLPRM